jgi:arylsulfatase A-like enzyme
MIRQGTYKLAVDRASGTPTHLFELESDPYEMNNRLGDSEQAERVAAMQDKISRKFAGIA